MIIAAGAAYALLMTFVPFARGVPRLPIPLLTFGVMLLLYCLTAIPDSVRRWLFYPLLALSYWELQFVVSTCTGRFRGPGLLQMEARLFGELPTLALQRALRTGPGVMWFEYAFAVMHALLFLIPVLLPLVILLTRGAARMRRATAALVLLSLAGYATYVLFPLTPPWMVSIEGSVEGLGDVPRLTLRALSRILPEGMVRSFSPSPRGAMPSLHTAVPVLMLLVSLREYGRRAWWLLLPVLVICFEIVYGGEHYVTDVAAGIVFALVSYLLTYRVLLPDNRLGGDRMCGARGAERGRCRG